MAEPWTLCPANILAVTADIATAPRDGNVVIVLHGPWQIPARAHWHCPLKAWVECGDPYYRPLKDVERWLDGSQYLKFMRPKRPG